ncbi:MAG: DUF2520 domain-containing protein [Bacteroidales bacterium]|jgi:predicted short-subunit dehydrogenase-like oxidoreductase (DUF2520 family)|nr:DUF2520 domain-containing protein [Bacteroidales bacterium]
MQSIQIIGNGNVAWHFQKALQNTSFYQVKQINSRVKSFDCSSDNFVIIAVKDDAIEEVAEKILTYSAIVLHTSGIKSIEVLRKKFANCGVLYPVQTFRKEREVDFTQVPLCIEANNKENLEKISNLAHHLTNLVYEIYSLQRQHLHLAATFANNFTNHLIGIAKQIAENANIDFSILNPLIIHTITESLSHDTFSLQTGAAKRNDVSTIKVHESMLGIEERKIYDIITEHIIKKYNKC